MKKPRPSASARRTGRPDAPHPGRTLKKLEADSRARKWGAEDAQRRIPKGDGTTWPAHGVTIAGKQFGAVAPRPPAICYLYEDLADGMEPMPVFGQYPRGLIKRLLPWLRCDRSQILHVCSGSLPKGEGIRALLEQLLNQQADVEPLERSALQRPVVQVEAVDVDDRPHDQYRNPPVRRSSRTIGPEKSKSHPARPDGS